MLVEATDLVFAGDSIPAVFAVTRDPFLVCSPDDFAILGLRALYFILGGVIGTFRYLRLGLSVVLIFIGAKMSLADVYEVPIGSSSGIITLVIAASIGASLLAPIPEEPPRRPEADRRAETDLDPHHIDREDWHEGIVMKNQEIWQRRQGSRSMDEPGTDSIRRQVEVTNSLGLTLRAAARFVVVAPRFQADILGLNGDKEVSGKSLVDLVTLIAPCGTRLDVEARGLDAREAVAALTGLLASWSRGTDVE